MQIKTMRKSTQLWLFILIFISLNTYAEDLKIIFIGDTQQRELFGYPTGFSSRQAQDLSQVAIRSSEQELFAKYVQKSVYDLEPDSTAVIHLGDLLDYSCESEWNSATSVLTQEQLTKTFLTPGNHDGIFQGNNHYGFWVKAWLKLMKLSNQTYDPGLQGHFSAVCDSRLKVREKYENPEFRKKDVFCSYLNSFKEAYISERADLKNACGIVEKARHNILTNNDVSQLKSLSQDIVSHNESESQSLKKNITKWSLYSSFPESATAEWTKGFFTQKIVFPLSDINNLHLILLDTSDWAETPKYNDIKCNNHNHVNLKNSKCGVVSKKQQNYVNRYIDSLSNNDIVILSGHYPLKDLNYETEDWLNSLSSSKSKKVMYLSAHTHNGYVTLNADKSPKEINIDSLIDFPSSYWSLKTKNGQVCMQPNEIWEKLDCGRVLESEFSSLKIAIENYNLNTKKWHSDAGEAQWRYRAKDSYRALRAFAKSKDLGISCEEMKEGFFENSSTSMPKVAEIVTNCQKQIDAVISNNKELQTYGACQALVGSAIFANKNPNEPFSEKNSNYSRSCLVN